MDTGDQQLLLAEHLEAFRKWSYESLVAEINRTRDEHDCLRHVEGLFEDGTE